MSWLTTATTEPAPLEGVLGLRPELLALFKRFYGQFWEGGYVSPTLIELARLRIAQLHDCEAQLVIRDSTAAVSDAQVDALQHWQHSDLFSPVERTALGIAEKFPWQHHEITDAEAAELREALGEPGFVAFMTACALFDANCRLRLVFEVEAYPVQVPLPASAGGTLF